MSSNPDASHSEANDGDPAAEKIPDKEFGTPLKRPAFNFSKKTEKARVCVFGGQESAGRLRNAGVEFIDENGGGRGLRLRNRQKPKQDDASPSISPLVSRAAMMAAAVSSAGRLLSLERRGLISAVIWRAPAWERGLQTGVLARVILLIRLH